MRASICIFIIIYAALPVWPVGQAALPTLTLSDHARYSALGEAGGAICYDRGAVHYNPAGLAFFAPDQKIPIGFEMSYEDLLPLFGLKDLYHNNFSLYGRYKNLIACAISRKYVSFGENEWTDEAGRSLGTFKAYDQFIIISLAGNLAGINEAANYALGVNIKFIDSHLADVPVGNENRRGEADGYAIDAGFIYREPFLKIFSAGITLQNMGPDIVYIDENQADPIPFNLKLAFGAVYTIPDILRLTIALDLNKELVRRRDGARDIEEYGEPQPPDPFWKAFVTAWMDDPISQEIHEIIRNWGWELLLFKRIYLRWGRMVDKTGSRWESTYGVGLDLKYADFSISSIGNLDHTRFYYDQGSETTGRLYQTKYTMGIKVPLCLFIK